VVGAGLIGLETAENLIEVGKKVTVIELGKQILGPWDEKFATFGKKILQQNGVEVRLQTSISSVSANGQMQLSNGDTLQTDYIIVAIGVVPNTQLLAAQGAETLANGALVVNHQMQTSLPNVYAAGDCAAMPHALTGEPAWFPMGTHSNKAGRAAGYNAIHNESLAFNGGYGTAIMKLFDYTIARTGMGPKELNRKEIDFKKVLIITGATPGFYPNQTDVFVEIYYDANSHVVLGAELIGKKGIDKRTDVLATAIYAKLTISDLPNLDLAYAPPFSTAKDAVVVAGFAASNYAQANFGNISVNELDAHADAQLIDVRNPQEVANTQLIHPDAVNIPLDELRNRLDELDPNQKYIVYCAKGLRGYLAATILNHHGITQVYNMDGGFTAWNWMS
jgi:pyruvate/2-oxoglutarate dehydrogenase complex dihydrolipoamide dehydrogenase (E3) component/rhodanese-related sulfurtransferase